MNNMHLDEKDLATHRDVITLGDYEMCPTVKNNNGENMIIVVKSDGMLRSFEAGRNYGDDDYCEPLENRAVGVSL